MSMAYITSYESHYIDQKYGTIRILTKILWNAFINILRNNIEVGFQTVLSI